MTQLLNFAKHHWRIAVLLPLSAVGFSNALKSLYDLPPGAVFVLRIASGVVFACALLYLVFQYGVQLGRAAGPDEWNRKIELVKHRLATCRDGIRYPRYAVDFNLQQANAWAASFLLPRKVFKWDVARIDARTRSIYLGYGSQSGLVPGLKFSVRTSTNGRHEYTLTAGDICPDTVHIQMPDAQILAGETTESISVDLLGFDPPESRTSEMEKYVGQILADIDEDMLLPKWPSDVSG